MDEYKEYMNQDIFNPKYLFHGSSTVLQTLEPRQSSDCENKDNEDNAIFLTSWFINSAAYAFSRKLKEVNEHYSFSMNNMGELPAMQFEVEYLPEDLYGYVHIFEISEDMIKDNHEHTTQYRCYHNLVPKKVIKVKYKDFEKYFIRNGIIKKLR